MKRRDLGFTLLEMAIVIVVIAILTLIVIPRLLHVGQKAKEASLIGDLHQLRDAIARFEADCGDYPANLQQLIGKPAADAVGGNDKALDISGWQGPYLRSDLYGPNPPIDPFTGVADWSYEPQTGDIHSSSSLTALDDSKYKDW